MYICLHETNISVDIIHETSSIINIHLVIIIGRTLTKLFSTGNHSVWFLLLTCLHYRVLFIAVFTISFHSYLSLFTFLHIWITRLVTSLRAWASRLAQRFHLGGPNIRHRPVIILITASRAVHCTCPHDRNLCTLTYLTICFPSSLISSFVSPLYFTCCSVNFTFLYPVVSKRHLLNGLGALGVNKLGWRLRFETSKITYKKLTFFVVDNIGFHDSRRNVVIRISL